MIDESHYCSTQYPKVTAEADNTRRIDSTTSRIYITFKPFNRPIGDFTHLEYEDYGLGATLYTKDLSTAMRVSNQLEAGTVSVNTSVTRCMYIKPWLLVAGRVSDFLFVRIYFSRSSTYHLLGYRQRSRSRKW
jgi:hypothetical protein